MRYYSIVITNPKTGQIQVPSSLKSVGATDATYTSFVNGKTLRGALNVELDIFVVPYASPAGGSWIRIWGVSLAEIVQSNDLNNFNIAVYGGMQRGLPLANPKQNGLLFAGTIYQAFGNWVGTEQTLELIMVPGPGAPGSAGGTGTIDDPKNITHVWKKGTYLKTAIDQTLRTAFPDYTPDIQIDPNLIYTEDDVGFYQTVEQYAQYINGLSKAIIGGTTYNGVDILLQDKKFFVFDGTVSQLPLDIDFKDMIGQPTWIGPGQMQVKLVMRADIKVGNFIKMPQGLVTTTSAAQSSQLDLQSAFKGQFLVNSVRHNGNFRQQDAASWVTVVDATPTQLN